MAKNKKGHVEEQDSDIHSMKHTMTKEKHEDWFLSASNLFIKFLENNRKKVLIGIISTMVFILAFSIFLFYRDGENEKIADMFYDSSTDFLEKAKNMELEKLRGMKPTDDEIAHVASGYKMILTNTKSRPESYLSQFNLAMIFYSIQDYSNAIHYFHQAYENKGDFPMAFQALLNIGHSYLNMGYKDQQKANYKEAIENYTTAYKKSYSKMAKDFPKSPAVPLAYRYAGLTQEYIADCHLMLKDQSKAKLALQKGKLEYQKLKDFATKKSSKFTSSPLRSPIDEANLGLLRVENKLGKMK